MANEALSFTDDHAAENAFDGATVTLRPVLVAIEQAAAGDTQLMKYTITTPDRGGAVSVRGINDKDAVAKARALMDSGAEMVEIYDQDGRPIDFEVLCGQVERAWREDLGI